MPEILSSTQPLLAGVAQADITPNPGIPLTGYIAREGVSVGVHDRLFATALAFRDGRQNAALVSSDLIGLDSPTVKSIRQKIQAATGIPPQNVMLACTHTHSGPATIFVQDCGDVDENYLVVLEEILVELVRRAVAQLQPVQIQAGRGALHGWAYDRRVPGAEIDPEVGVICLRDLQGKPAAVIVNFACHPVALGADNRMISADYPGVLKRELQEALGCPAIFLTGAPGNVDPLQRGSFQVAQAFGEALAEEALRVINGLVRTSSARLTVSSLTLDLRLNPIPGEETLCASMTTHQQKLEEATRLGQPLEAKIQQAMLHWAEATLAKVKGDPAENSAPCELQVLGLGGVTVVGVAGELFSALGHAIKAGDDGKRIVLVSAYTNGDIGYIPTREAYEQGGYEIEEAYRYYGYPSALSPEAGDRIVTAARELLASHDFRVES